MAKHAVICYTVRKQFLAFGALVGQEKPGKLLARASEETNTPDWAHCLSCIVQGFSRASLETRESLRPLSFPQTEQGHKEIQV